MSTPAALNADFDLTQLARVPLDPLHVGLWQRALAMCHGSPIWQSRKRSEAYEVLALAQVSRRLIVLGLDLRGPLRVHFRMRAPVPCLPDRQGELQIAPWAELGLCYAESALVEPQPGYNFICLLHPWHAWIPNVASPEFGQRLCLGPQLPAGTRLREIIFLTYQALTLASVQFNPFDPAGVMNAAAAEWYQRNPGKIPLRTEPFLAGVETMRSAPAAATPQTANA